MKTLKMIIVVFVVIGFVFTQQVIGADVKVKKSIIKKKQVVQPVSKAQKAKTMKMKNKPAPKGPGDPDLRATIVSVIPQPDGRVIINGAITNIGLGDFISAPSSAEGQVVVLLNGVTGPASLVYLTTQPIPRLNRGQTIRIQGTYTIPDFADWGHVNLERGECAAQLNVDFIVWVTYDPDIMDDGNEDNDDSDWSNNEDRKHSMSMPNVRDYKAECPE